MARISWTRCFAQVASAAVIVGLASAASLAVRSDDAEACSGWSPSVADMTTFDPGVLGDDSWGGLEYDPFTEGFGGACDSCSQTAMLDDWHGFLKEAVKREDWEQVLLKSTLSDIFAIEKRLSRLCSLRSPTLALWVPR